MTVLVQGMKGLGDNIFQRAFVRSLVASGEQVYLTTPWPELYADLPVRFVRQDTPLRTQAKNIARQNATRWVPRPTNARVIDVRYGSVELRQGSICEAMQRCFGVAPAQFDLPQFPRFASSRKPLALVRPVTERKEWLNPARNPRPEYVNAIAQDLMRDYHVVSVADLVDGVEWLVGEAPPAHQRFHAGELTVSELLGLLQTASVVLGGVGWIVPAAIVTGVPLFCVMGGNGMHNHPLKITDPRMNLDHVGFAMPDAFCHCDQMRHACNRTNSRLAEQWAEFRGQQGL